MPKFYTIFARKINKIPEFYMIYAQKINKMPEFYMIFDQKIFFPNFGGQVPPPCPPSSMTMTEININSPNFLRSVYNL